jgi:LuxR family maltose regulon positive regulatory protein
VVEIRAGDLRFTFEEASSFLNQVKGLDLSGQALDTIITRAEGWITGLQFAALALSGLSGHDRQHFIQNFSGAHRYMGDYFTEQVLHRQPPDLQAFMLQTSILDRFSESLCNAITRNTDGHAMLARLEAANLFLVQLDNERRWFRYHRLFAEYLRELLYGTFPDLVPVLHRRAVQWFESRGHIEEAVQHALETKDHDLVAYLITQLREFHGRQSHVNTLLKLMRALPPDYIRSRPNLCLGYAWSYAINGKFDQVETLLKLVENYLQQEQKLLGNISSEDETAPTGTFTRVDRERRVSLAGLQADLDVLRAFVARFTADVALAIEHGQRALEGIPAERWIERAIVLLFVGHAQLLLGNDSGAMQNLNVAITLNEIGGSYSGYLSAVNYMSQLLVLQGRLQEAIGLNKQALHFVNQQPFKVLTGIERIGLGDLLREQNDLESAQRYIDEGIYLAEQAGDFVFIRDGYLARARLCLARADPAGALQAIQRAESLVQRGYPAWDTMLVEAWKARALLAQGNPQAAAQWAQDVGSRVEDSVDYVKTFIRLTLARICLAQGQLHEARRLLENMLSSSERAGRTGRVIEVLIIQALFFQAMGDEQQALNEISRALTLAEPQGYMRIFLDEGKSMAVLLQTLASYRPVVRQPYLNRLNAAFGSMDAPIDLKDIDHRRDFPDGDILSDREIEVLRLLEAGQTYQEIADELVIALSTVQSHIKNVYSKLDVHSGLEAVARARQLSLLHSNKPQLRPILQET